MIEEIHITEHRLVLDPPFEAAWDTSPRESFSATVVRVRDDSGAVGIGAGGSMDGSISHLELFVGRDPTDLDRHAAVLANVAFHDGRPWPLEVALWDLVGKLSDRPLWEMVGGSGRAVPAYASTGTLRSPGESVESAIAAAEAGFGALKLRLGRADLHADLSVIAAVREAVPAGFELMVDCNQGWRMPWDTDPAWTLARATTTASELEQIGVSWMEEPLHRGDHAGMAELRRRTSIPVAGGEMTREMHEFDLMLDAGCLDVYQPDVVLTGGMTALAELAHRVVDAGHTFTPHTWGSGLALLANLHLTAGTVGAPFIEYPWDPPTWTAARRDFLLAEPVEPDRDGVLRLTGAPGLGAELDEDRLDATEEASISVRRP